MEEIVEGSTSQKAKIDQFINMEFMAIAFTLVMGFKAYSFDSYAFIIIIMKIAVIISYSFIIFIINFATNFMPLFIF